MSNYIPDKTILHHYAKVLVDFALNSGKGIKKGDTVRLVVPESAKPLLIELRNAVLRSGGNPLISYLPDDITREYFELASDAQLQHFPKHFMKGIVDQVDHTIHIISETNKHELEGIDPKKIMTKSKAAKPFKDWQDHKENLGKFTWTIALYGTQAMADEANLSLKEYWQEIIQACFLDESDPIGKWRQVFTQNELTQKKLNNLNIDKLHVEGENIDLWVKIGPNRKWLGGSGRNIPSFELFISPDWRGTEGHIKFNQPLYRYGSLIKDVELEFKRGLVVKSSSSTNYPILKEMIATENADKIGEFSLTDKRLSRINKFMAETLFDENISGPFGNTHLALGSAYHDSYVGNPAKISKTQWVKMGFNNSAVHTDIVSTTKRTVTAYLANGTIKIIYRDGEFVL